MYLCEQCGKEVHEVYGSGRFCSRSCSNKWVALHQSPEAKACKVEAGINNFIAHKSDPNRIHRWSEQDKRNHSILMKEVMSDIDVRQKISNSLRGRVFSESTRSKISLGVRKSHLEGRNKGWSKRTIHSYAENFWKSVLDNNSINYIQEFKVTKKSIGVVGTGCYFLDFLIDGKIDLEIDGKQHYELSRKLHDEERDSNLRKAGYLIYRVKYRNPILSDLVKRDIESFLKWYHEHRGVG